MNSAAGIAVSLFAAAAFSSCRTNPVAVATAPSPGQPVPETKRVSDGYSFSAVASYQVFEAAIPQHVLTLFVLKSGGRLPMLCKCEVGRMAPIPQSVFTTPIRGEYSILCEPQTTRPDGAVMHSLMEISVTICEDVLVSGGRKLPLVSPKPVLVAGSRG